MVLVRRGARPSPAATPAPTPTKKTLAVKRVIDPNRGAELAESIRASNEAREAIITINRYKDKIKNPKTAIRAKCVECSGGSLKEVNECKVTDCALYPFRMGQNPFNKKTRDRLAREATPGEDSDDDDSGDDEEGDE